MWYRRTVTREKPQQGCHYSCPFRDARGELPLRLADRAGLPAQQRPHQIPRMPSGNFNASVSAVLSLRFRAIGWPPQEFSAFLSLHEIACFLPRAYLWGSKPQRDSQVPGFQEEGKHYCLSPNKFTGSVYWRATYTYKGYTSAMCAFLLHISYVFPEIQGPLQLLPRNQRQSAFMLALWTSYQLYGIKSPSSPETYKKGFPALSERAWTLSRAPGLLPACLSMVLIILLINLLPNKTICLMSPWTQA